MIQNIIDNLKNQGIEIDLAQSNLIQKMIKALPQEKSFINKFKKSFRSVLIFCLIQNSFAHTEKALSQSCRKRGLCAIRRAVRFW